jgi:carboxylate-amine ligase
VDNAISELREARAYLTRIAEPFGYALIAASTHPFDVWQDHKTTNQNRYRALQGELGMPMQRMLVCGMHFHIEVLDPDLRILLMKDAATFLPYLLALSAASPFWAGYDTGLASYRLSVFDALPRTGPPPIFDDYANYRTYADHLVQSGAIDDVTKIWWDMRPSEKYPTIEQRVTDMCCDLDDTAALAALFQCLIRYLYRMRENSLLEPSYKHLLAAENRWRAQRNGVQGTLLGLCQSKMLSMTDLVETLILHFYQDAQDLECFEALKHLRCIATRGTSADHQRNVYAKSISKCAKRKAALVAVVDHLITNFTTFHSSEGGD